MGGIEGVRADRGETLLELVIALAILTVAVVAVVGGLSAGVFMADVHRKQATAGATVRDYAEAIESTVASGGYIACAGPASYATPAGFAPPAGYTASVVPASVRYWTGTAWQGSASTCLSSGDRGLQRLTLQAASTDGRAAEQLDVVLRKPCRLADAICG